MRCQIKSKLLHVTCDGCTPRIDEDNDRVIMQSKSVTYKNGEIIKESEVKALCSKAREILVEESNVQRVDSPVTVSFF